MTISDLQVSFELPPGWQIRMHPDTGVVARARPRDRAGDAVPPEVVVRHQPVDDDLLTWRQEALAALAGQLTGFEVEDQDTYDLGRHRVHYHRFGHRLGTVELISDQWAWLVEGWGVTLTGTVAREEYAAYCDAFEDMALTVEVLPPGGARSPAPGRRSAARW
jgi:hypothetical protein